jgi:hypothetical protein
MACLKPGVHMFEKRLDDGLVALEENPLTDPFRRDQTRALQRCEMRGHGGLRQATARVDLARAYTVIQREFLVGEMSVRLTQPAKDFAADRVGKRFVNRVDVGCHEGVVSFKRQLAGEIRVGICIATRRILYRILTICTEATTGGGAMDIDIQKSAHLAHPVMICREFSICFRFESAIF